MYWLRTLKNGSVVLRKFGDRKCAAIEDDISETRTPIIRDELAKTKFVLTNTDNAEGSIAWAKIRGSGWSPSCVVDLDGAVTQLVPWNYKPTDFEECWTVAFVNPGEFEPCDGGTMRSKFGSIAWDPDIHGPMLDSINLCVLTKDQIMTAMYMLAAVNWQCGSVNLTIEPESVFGGLWKQFSRK